MGQLGISIYPSKSSFEEMAAYLEMVAEIGYRRVFTSMLEVADEAEASLDTFKSIIGYARDLGLKTSLDVNAKLFDRLGADAQNLEVFKEMGIWSIRLDEGFTGLEEALMSHNPYGIKLEFNISRGQHYIDLICDFGANRDNIHGSHNFYPQAYTGLDLAYFKETAKRYKDLYLRTAAFVDTASGKVGPWAHSQLMVSTEVQRQMPLTSQIKLLKMTGMIDDIIISSSLVSESDLKEAWQAFQSPVPELGLVLAEGNTETENRIILEEKHLYRGDYSAYMIRSSHTRVIYKDSSLDPRPGEWIRRGDVTLGNNLAGQYKAELQIALKDRPNDGLQNVVARLVDSDLILLDHLEPWQSFRLVVAE